jgi:hypothetical protein
MTARDALDGDRVDERSLALSAFEPAERNGSLALRAFPIGGPTTKAWREQALTRIAELRTLTALYRRKNSDPAAEELACTIHGHLDEARHAAEGSAARKAGRLRSWGGGACLERTASNLDAAEADLLRLAPVADVRAQMPSLRAHVRDHLDPDDPRRKSLDQIAERFQNADPGEIERSTVVAAVRAASSEARREVVRVRSFRNVLLVAATLLAVAAGGIAVLGVVNPDVIPLCFAPES